MDNLWSRLLANVIKLLSGSLLISEVSLLGLSETQVKSLFSQVGYATSPHVHRGKDIEMIQKKRRRSGGTEGKRNKQMGKTGVKDQLLGKHRAVLLQV